MGTLPHGHHLCADLVVLYCRTPAPAKSCIFSCLMHGWGTPLPRFIHSFLEQLFRPSPLVEKKKTPMQWEFPGHPVVDSTLPVKGVWVRSLVREIRSCMSQGMTKQTDHKTKQNKTKSKTKKHLCKEGVEVGYILMSQPRFVKRGNNHEVSASSQASQLD